MQFLRRPDVLFVLFVLLFTPAAYAQHEALRQEIERIARTTRAEVAVAITDLSDGDTLTHLGHRRYPMQSVYKLHLAAAVLNQVDQGKLRLDQPVRLGRADLPPGTWSPLRERYPRGEVALPLREILYYTLAESDNNGADVLFRLLGGPAVVNAFINKLAVGPVAITATEAQMQRDWETQFTNYSTVAAVARLLSRLHGNQLLTPDSHTFLWQTLRATSTGPHRLRGGLPAGTVVAHKTGTSGRNDAGMAAVVNDAGVIALPDGRLVVIVVFVANAYEDTPTCEAIIAQVARATWDHYTTR